MTKSDWGQRAFEAGKRWITSGDAGNSGVANARVNTYGFSKWWNSLHPSDAPGLKGYLKKSFMEGVRAGKRVSNPHTVSAKSVLKAGKSILAHVKRVGNKLHILPVTRRRNGITSPRSAGGDMQVSNPRRYRRNAKEAVGAKSKTATGSASGKGASVGRTKTQAGSASGKGASVGKTRTSTQASTKGNRTVTLTSSPGARVSFGKNGRQNPRKAKSPIVHYVTVGTQSFKIIGAKNYAEAKATAERLAGTPIKFGGR